jgi:hypothetical protein
MIRTQRENVGLSYISPVKIRRNDLVVNSNPIEQIDLRSAVYFYKFAAVR